MEANKTIDLNDNYKLHIGSYERDYDQWENCIVTTYKDEIFDVMTEPCKSGFSDSINIDKFRECITFDLNPFRTFNVEDPDELVHELYCKPEEVWSWT